MAAQIIDGRLISQTVRQEVAARVEARKAAGLRAPALPSYWLVTIRHPRFTWVAKDVFVLK